MTSSAALIECARFLQVMCIQNSTLRNELKHFILYNVKNCICIKMGDLYTNILLECIESLTDWVPTITFSLWETLNKFY